MPYKYCLLSTVNCLLSTAYCLLPTAYFCLTSLIVLIKFPSAVCSFSVAVYIPGCSGVASSFSEYSPAAIR